MKISNVFILLGAVIMGLVVVPRYIFVSPQLEAEQDYFVTPERTAQIRQLLSDELTLYNRACIYEGPFPFERRYSGQCNRCEELERVGLIKKTIEERTVGGEFRVETKFDLTDLGKRLYSEKPEIPGRPEKPRFCFGTPVLHAIKGVTHVKLLNNPGAPGYAVRFVVELKDVQPEIFDLAPLLKLAVPERSKPGEPVLYPAESVTTVYSYNQMSVHY